MSSKLLLDSNLFYFDGHIAITDPGSNWTNDANAFDGSTTTSATTAAASSTSSLYLYGQGTTAPSTGSATISSVQARLYGISGTLGRKTKATIFTASLAEQLNASAITSSASNSATDWGSYVTLTAPSAGWSWSALNALEVKLYADDATGAAYRVELLVSYGSPSDAVLLENTIRAYQTISGDSFTLGASGNATGIGQAVQGTGVAIGDVSFYLKKTGAPTGNYTAKVYATTGSFSSTAAATGTALATSDNFDISTLTTAFNWAKFTFSGANQITLTNGTTYAITFEYNGGDASNLLTVGWDATSANDPGNAMRLIGTWGSSGSADANYILNSNTTSYLLQENDVQLRQSTAYVGTAAQTNMTFTLDNAPVVGNLLIATILYWTGDNPFLTPSGWTLQGTVQEAGQTGIATIYRVVVGGDTASWNLTVLTVADQNSGYMWEVMGQHATVATAFNQLSVTHATSSVTSIASGSITPTVLNTLVLSATMTMGTTSTDQAVYPAGWSERKFINSTFQPAWAYQKNGYTTDTTTAISYTVTGLPSAQQATVIMAIAPATVGGTVLTLTQPAMARIAQNISKTQPSIARIANDRTKTQPAISRISNTRTLTQPTIARIARTVTKTQPATARIANTGLVKTQGAIARIATTRALTQTAVSRIAQNYTKTQGATARIGNAYLASLASYWKFDDASGSTATDSIGGNNGTWQGTLGSQWGTGKIGGDGVFNGTDNYVAVGDKANLSFNTGNYTLSAWVKTTATARQTILHKYQYTGTSVESGYYIDMLAGGNIRTVYETTNANLRNTDSSVTINDGNWHLVTVVRPSTTGDILLYVDGTLDASSTHAFNAGTPGNIDNTIPFAIGQTISASIGVNDWNGQIDEVGAWSRALSGTEVSNLYNLNVGLPYPFTATASVITKTQAAIARIATNRTKSQPVIARLSQNYTKTQPSIARIARNVTKTQTATANILQNLTPTKTQTAIARIATTRSLTQGAVSRISQSLTKTQPAVSRISNTRTLPQPAIARIAKNVPKTQPAIARIAQTITKTQPATARIQLPLTKTQTAISRIAQNYTKTQPVVARIAKNLTKTQTATANIIVNTTLAKTQGAIARIATTRALTQTAISRISQTYTKTQTGISRIANTRTKTQTATARIATSVTKTQSAVSRIANNKTKTQPVVSRISQILAKTQPVIARVATIRTLTQPATAKITINGSVLTKTQPATGRIAVNRATTQSATGRIANNRNLTQPAISRISRNFTKTQAATGRISQTYTKTQSATARITAVLIRTFTQNATAHIYQTAIVTRTTNLVLTVSAPTALTLQQHVSTIVGKQPIVTNLTLTKPAATSLVLTQRATNLTLVVPAPSNLRASFQTSSNITATV